MHGGTQPAGCITPSGELWFPSNRGPVRIVPDQTRPGDLPQVVIEHVFVDGREETVGDRLVVAPGEGKLRIDYSAIRLRSQERIRFRYKLEGFDRDWTEPLNSRVANYTNLPAREYRFWVQAFEMNMPDKATQALLGIELRPHVYRTGWFLALCAALIFGLIIGVYRLRLRQVHEKFEAVLEERNRIAREMHDTVIQGCASTSALLEAVVSLETDECRPGRELLDSAREQVRATVDEARRAVWDLRQKGTTPPEISPLLDQMIKQASHVSHVSVQFESSGTQMPLDDAVAHVVLMVAREAVYNAVRHAQPRKVRVSVQFAIRSVRMQVVDDGRGFDPKEAFAAGAGHFGLVGMRERIEGVGGHFEVKTSHGKGTVLSVEVPVRLSSG